MTTRLLLTPTPASKIPVNIWDDYCDDGFVPEGSKQETYIYVEDMDIPQETHKGCLGLLLEYINQNIKIDGIKMWMEWRDWKKLYPALVGTEHEQYAFSRWEIRIENLTHAAREAMVEKLQDAGLIYNGVKLDIYSES